MSLDRFFGICSWAFLSIAVAFSSFGYAGELAGELAAEEIPAKNPNIDARVCIIQLLAEDEWEFFKESLKLYEQSRGLDSRSWRVVAGLGGLRDCLEMPSLEALIVLGHSARLETSENRVLLYYSSQQGSLAPVPRRFLDRLAKFSGSLNMITCGEKVFVDQNLSGRKRPAYAEIVQENSDTNFSSGDLSFALAWERISLILAGFSQLVSQPVTLPASK